MEPDPDFTSASRPSCSFIRLRPERSSQRRMKDRDPACKVTYEGFHKTKGGTFGRSDKVNLNRKGGHLCKGHYLLRKVGLLRTCN